MAGQGKALSGRACSRKGKLRCHCSCCPCVANLVFGAALTLRATNRQAAAPCKFVQLRRQRQRFAGDVSACRARLANKFRRQRPSKKKFRTRSQTRFFLALRRSQRHAGDVFAVRFDSLRSWPEFDWRHQWALTSQSWTLACNVNQALRARIN